MRISTVLFVALSALVLFLAPAAQAQTARPVARCDAARVDKAAGVARTLSDCGRVSLAHGAERAARQAVGRVAGTLGVRRDTRDLALLRASSTPGGPRLRFQQYVSGVPVRNGQVTVALGTDGSTLLLGSAASADRTLDATPRVSRAEALLLARRRVPSGFDTVAAPTTTLVAEPDRRGRLELAWQVMLPARAPRGDWIVVVSARTGEVLEAYDAITRVNGTALTYSPNPVQQTGDTALRDLNDSDQPALTSARQLLALTDLTAGTPLIRGTFANPTASGVSGCSLPYVPGQASSATRTYNNTRSQDAFEEAAAYLALTRVQRTYAALGFPGIFSGPVPIDVHCISFDQSFFSPFDHALHMGDGGVDDAEDSDVTVHEFGHATQEALVPGFGPGDVPSEQQAIGEGFGDFLASYIYLEDGNAGYQATHRFCVAEWDATSYLGSNPTGCLRWVDGTNEVDGTDIGTYGGTPVEEHDDGRYWSAMLTCVFDGVEPALGTALARDRMLALVLAHHAELVPTRGVGAFEDSLLALRIEDDARFNGDELQLLDQCGQQRLNIAPDPTPPVVQGALSPAGPDGANGWYRTAPAVTWTITEPDSTFIQDGCVQDVDPADTPGRTLTCTVTSRGGMTTASPLTYKKDATPPTLAATLSNAAPRVGDAITATPNASDALSGVAAQSCATPDTSSAGVKTVSCSATDAAGNSATQTLTYIVSSTGRRAVPLTFKVSKVRVARNGNLSFRVKASRSVRVKFGAKAGKVTFRSRSKRLTRNRTTKVTLKLSKRARARLLRRLRGGRRVRVKLTLRPTGRKAVRFTFRVRRR